jgi:hypothetical protein
MAAPAAGAAGPLGDRHAEQLELALAVAEAEADLEPAAAQLVEHGDVLGEAQRVLERAEQDRGADPHRRRPLRDRGQHREDRRQVAVAGDVVLGEPDRLVAELFRPRDLVEVLAVERVPGPVPAGRVAEVVPDPESHRM